MLHISVFITVMPVRQVPVLRTPCALSPLEVAIVAGEIIRHVCTLSRGPEVRSSKAHPRKYRGADDGREMLPTNIPQLTAQQRPYIGVPLVLPWSLLDNR